jgi:hexosaminidase
VVTSFLEKWIAMNNDLIALSANAPLIQPVLPMSNNLSVISALLVIEENKMLIKKD